ncbi:MAG: GNAT family N-acetyltransferase [Chthonomonadaceae bacterium]|nr:GNAT family N-acetyltransferase [Chthonomonadaceae bacterium]
MLIREYRDGDGPGVVQSVQATYADYGFSWDADGYCKDLYDVPNSYEWFWVVESENEVVGCTALSLHRRVPGELGQTVVVEGTPRVSATDCELHRLYIRPEVRGHRLGEKLLRTTCAKATELGCSTIEIWSDKKLTHAHGLYERLGAIKSGERICPGDPDESPEWGFYLPLPI